MDISVISLSFCNSAALEGLVKQNMKYFEIKNLSLVLTTIYTRIFGFLSNDVRFNLAWKSILFSAFIEQVVHWSQTWPPHKWLRNHIHQFYLLSPPISSLTFVSLATQDLPGWGTGGRGGREEREGGGSPCCHFEHTSSSYLLCSVLHVFCSFITGKLAEINPAPNYVKVNLSLESDQPLMLHSQHLFMESDTNKKNLKKSFVQS